MFRCRNGRSVRTARGRKIPGRRPGIRRQCGLISGRRIERFACVRSAVASPRQNSWAMSWASPQAVRRWRRLCQRRSFSTAEGGIETNEENGSLKTGESLSIRRDAAVDGDDLISWLIRRRKRKVRTKLIKKNTSHRIDRPMKVCPRVRAG